MNQTQSTELLARYIKARYPIIAIVSHEESRVLSSVHQLANSRKSRVAEWSATTGWNNLPHVEPDATRDPASAFEALLAYAAERELDDQEPTIFVMKDLHGMLGSRDRGFHPILVRYLRDVAARLEVTRHSLILLSPSFAVPPDLDKTVAVMDWPLPDVDELAGILALREADLPAGIPVTLNGNRDAVVQALRGLTQFEAESVLLSAVVATRELGAGVIPFVIKEKAQIIRKAGVLEYYDNTITMQDVGGLGALKLYADKKHAAFSSSARAAGVDAPKGVLLVGVPGTGKSLSAKAIAGAFQMPLLRMDVGALMGGLVGQSEANARNALAVAEAVAPCVLWIDEIEKALGGSGAERDGGTSTRVFGTILTWMQEKTAPVYVVATANDITALQPELISRFDDVVFVDLPAAAARAEILRVHLAKRNQDAARFDLPAVASALWGFSGREIEKVVRSALETAYYEQTALTTAHLLAATRELVPVLVTMREKIDAIRAWVKTSQARQADDPLDPQPVVVSQAVRSIEL